MPYLDGGPNPYYRASAPGDWKSVLAVVAGMILGNSTLYLSVRFLVWMFP